MRKDTQSPKQEQSVAPQNGPWSRQKFLKKTSLVLVSYPMMQKEGLVGKDQQGRPAPSCWFMAHSR